MSDEKETRALYFLITHHSSLLLPILPILSIPVNSFFRYATVTCQRSGPRGGV
jgi:hypothetical protein